MSPAGSIVMPGSAATGSPEARTTWPLEASWLWAAAAIESPSAAADWKKTVLFMT
jgi:hypothetical protein